MHTTRKNEGVVTGAITVNINGLAELLGVGKGTADKIGREAGAVIMYGGRKLFSVAKVRSYMEKLAESEV